MSGTGWRFVTQAILDVTASLEYPEGKRYLRPNVEHEQAMWAGIWNLKLSLSSACPNRFQGRCGVQLRQYTIDQSRKLRSWRLWDERPGSPVASSINCYMLGFSWCSTRSTRAWRVLRLLMNLARSFAGQLRDSKRPVLYAEDEE